MITPGHLNQMLIGSGGSDVGRLLLTFHDICGPGA